MNQKRIKMPAYMGQILSFDRVLSGFCAVALIGYGGWMVAIEKITLGTVVAFNGYLWMLIMPVRMLGWIVNIIGHAITSGRSI